MEQLFDVLLPRHTLEEALGPELAKQYRLARGEDCQYMPVSAGEHYLCTCGSVNAAGEACGACGRPQELLDRTALEELRREAEARLEREDRERASLEAQQREEEKRLKRKKILRICMAAAGALVFLVLAAAAFWAITRIAVPASHYRKALAALEEKDYQKAHRCFVLAGDYRDAEEYLARFYTPCLSVSTRLGDFTVLREYEYDENGRLLKTTERQLAPGADGKLLDTQEPVVYRRTYDRMGNALLVEDWYGSVQYTYNEKGDPVLEECYRSDGQREYTKDFVYAYDEAGRMTMSAEICSEHISVNYSYEQTVYYTYDDRGLVASQITEVNYPAQMESNCRTTTTWRYNSDGKPVEKEAVVEGLMLDESNSREKCTWTYDEAGRTLAYTSVIEYAKDALLNNVKTTTDTYNSRGDLLEEKTVSVFPNDPSRNVTTGTTKEYNWEGKLVKEAHRSAYADPQREEYSGVSYTSKYAYDLLGRRVGYEMVMNQHGEVTKQKDVYTFGFDGMATEMKSVQTWGEDGRMDTVITYNENGLAKSWTYESEDDGGTSEYTYAYFYFPEGTEMPSQEPVDRMLYGEAFYDG